ncbi:AraC family transcriptional regulator [Pyxidicoccus caerfyrddinensis]|uniref:AraC family transcriptional regulator n=1 Tax=Pyxidicoccus caerfyrddinensis TaxID=2709663 RepID=UPI0013D9F80F|nr:AraC family transcriptional regulator [Pyxidicoccus caerfyrddinensis]
MRTEESDAGMRFTVSAGALGALLAYARGLGVETQGMLASAGLEEASLSGPEARVPQAAYNRVWELIVEASGDEDFGLHFAERLDLDAFHVIGHLAAKSATVREALSRIVAYSRILHDAGRVELEAHEGLMFLYPGCRGLPHSWPRHIAEFSTASAVVLLRRITGQRSWTPTEVRFRHTEPRRRAEHQRLLGVSPRFGQPETLLAFPPDFLDMPIVTREPGVGSYLEAYARDVLSRLPSTEDDLPARVRHAIAQRLGNGASPPDVEDVATQLALGARTLQRRLREQDTTYAALVGEVQRAYAERYLADDGMTVAEVAFLTGFADVASFHRAFRRWTGTTPAAFRAARPPR